MTLRSAARPRRAIKSHLYFTSITLAIHTLLSHSHVFHLSVTSPAKCPVKASQLIYQCFEAGFYKALNNSLCFSKGFTSFGPVDFISMPLLSLRGLFPDIAWSFSFSEANCVTNDWTKEAHTHTLVSHLVTRFLCLLKQFTNFRLFFSFYNS